MCKLQHIPWVQRVTVSPLESWRFCRMLLGDCVKPRLLPPLLFKRFQMGSRTHRCMRWVRCLRPINVQQRAVPWATKWMNMLYCLRTVEELRCVWRRWWFCIFKLVQTLLLHSSLDGAWSLRTIMGLLCIRTSVVDKTLTWYIACKSRGLREKRSWNALYASMRYLSTGITLNTIYALCQRHGILRLN